MFSSNRNFILGSRQESRVFFGFNELCRKVENSFDRINIKRRVGFEDFLRPLSSFQEFQDKVHHYTRPLKTRLAMADFRIDSDIIFDFHFITSFAEKVYHSLDNLSSRAYADMAMPIRMQGICRVFLRSRIFTGGLKYVKIRDLRRVKFKAFKSMFKKLDLSEKERSSKWNTKNFALRPR